MEPIAAGNLSLEAVLKIISDLKAACADPVSGTIGIFGALGQSATVSGTTLRQALSASGISLAGPAAALVNGIENISKSGSAIEITNTGTTEVTFGDTPLRVLGEVTFVAGQVADSPTLSDIKGLAAHKLFWLDIQTIQLKKTPEQTLLHVVTSAGSRDIPVH